MIKVQILTSCENGHGQASLPVGESEDHQGNKYTRYQPCPCCEGSGQSPKWIDLTEFIKLIEGEH